MKPKSLLIWTGAVCAGLLSFSIAAQANDEIEKRAKDPNQWGAHGRDNQLTRHSPLADINAENVGKLGLCQATMLARIPDQTPDPVQVRFSHVGHLGTVTHI